MLADLHARRGQPAEALARLEKIFALQPSFTSLNLWAWIHAEEGTDLAEAEQRALAARRSRSRELLDTFGWIAHLQGSGSCAVRAQAPYASHRKTIRFANTAACDGGAGHGLYG